MSSEKLLHNETAAISGMKWRHDEIGVVSETSINGS